MSQQKFDAIFCGKLALAGQWSEIVDHCSITLNIRDRLTAGLWQVRSLRALERGGQANDILVQLANSPFEASVSEVAELAEELVQANYHDLSEQIAARLLVAGAKAQGSYISAILLREREEWSAAENTLQELETAESPWPALARIQRAWVLLRQGRGRAAFIELGPLAVEQHLGVQKLLARIEIQTSQFSKAEQRLLDVSKRQPLDWEWPGLLGVAKANLPGPNAADIRRLYDTALARQPRQPDVLVNRARIALAFGELESARIDTDDALACKPWYDPPVLVWTEYAVARKVYVEARRSLNAARKNIDTPRRAAAALDLDRMDTNFSRSLLERRAQALSDQFLQDSNAQRSAGAAMQQIGKHDQAALFYEKALRLAPEDFGTLNNLALLYRERGDIDEAIANWRLCLDDANATVLVNFAIALSEHGDRGEARSHMEELLKREPNNAAAHRVLADIAHHAGEDVTALFHAESALRLDAQNHLSWITLERIKARQLGEQAALTVLGQALGVVSTPLPIHQAMFSRWRKVLRPEALLERVSLWCTKFPSQHEYWLMASDAAHDANRFDECERCLLEVRRINFSEGGRALVRFYITRDREEAAHNQAKQLVKDDPDLMSHWGMLAEVQYRQDLPEEALKTLGAALKRQPGRLSLVRQKVGILLAMERFMDAVAEATTAVEADPKPFAIALLMEALGRARMHSEAVAITRERLKHSPQNQMLRQTYARALERAGDLPAAISEFADLHKNQPGNLLIAEQYVRVLVSMDRFEEAINTLRNMIRMIGSSPDLTVSVAGLMQEHGALNEARFELQLVWQEHPDSLPVAMQMVNLERRCGQTDTERTVWQGVIERFPVRNWISRITPHIQRLGLDKAVEAALNKWRVAEPDSPAPWWHAFYVAKELKRYAIALSLLDQIEKRTGPSSQTHSYRADLFQELWRIGDALREIRAAIDLRPNEFSYRQKLFDILVKSGDFDEIDPLLARMEKLLGDRRYAYYKNLFFNVNCHPTWSAEHLWHFYRDWYERAVKPLLPAFKPHDNLPNPNRRLRVGYLSPDFRRHAVAYFSEPLLIGHERNEFELFAYAHLEPGQEDQYTARFKSYVHHWVEIAGMSDMELERRIRNDKIDILVDLAGHTTNNRLGLMTRRPAPLQVSWIWGAGQTTGLPQINAFMADLESVPSEHNEYMAERVLRMGRAGLPFKPADDMPEPVPLPCSRNNYITFGVLARPLRTNRRTVAVWAQILQAVPLSVIRFDHSPYVEQDVQTRMVELFAEHGVHASRLQFHNTRPHWLAYHAIDILLDPFPAGSATTASESLFMERVVVTLRDRPVMGRITHGQLSAVDLQTTCSAGSEDEYVDFAVALAQNQSWLIDISTGLRERTRASWLTDYDGLGQEVSRLYRGMWTEWCNNSLALNEEIE